MSRFSNFFAFILLGTLLGSSLSEGQESPSGTSKTVKSEVTTLRTEPSDVSRQLLKDFEMMKTFPGYDALGSRFGLTLAGPDDVLRSQLDIPAHEGLVVVKIKAGSLSDQAGIKPKDVLLKLGDKPLTSVNQVAQTLFTLGRVATPVVLIREGKPRTLTLVGPEHFLPTASSEYWIGVPVSLVDPTLRSHLADLPEESGLVANDVVKDSPADSAGVKKYDILLSMGGKPLKNQDGLIEQVKASGGKPLPLVLLRAGKLITLEVTPTRRTSYPQTTYTSQTRYMTRMVEPPLGVSTVIHPPGTGQGRQFATQAAERPINLQFEVLAAKTRTDLEEASERIENQLKELNAKIEAIRSAVEGIKKSEPK